MCQRIANLKTITGNYSTSGALTHPFVISTASPQASTIYEFLSVAGRWPCCLTLHILKSSHISVGWGGTGVCNIQWHNDKGTNLKMSRKEVKHPEIPRPGILKKKTQSTRGGMRSDSSNPTSAQPPSLLPPVHQLICLQGDSNQGATAWQAVRVRFTHNAWTILKDGKRNWGLLITPLPTSPKNQITTSGSPPLR